MNEFDRLFGEFTDFFNAGESKGWGKFMKNLNLYSLYENNDFMKPAAAAQPNVWQDFSKSNPNLFFELFPELKGIGDRLKIGGGGGGGQGSDPETTSNDKGDKTKEERDQATADVPTEEIGASDPEAPTMTDSQAAEYLASMRRKLKNRKGRRSTMLTSGVIDNQSRRRYAG